MAELCFMGKPVAAIWPPYVRSQGSRLHVERPAATPVAEHSQLLDAPARATELDSWLS